MTKSNADISPKPITIQAVIGDTSLIRLADNIKTVTIDGKTQYEYDEVVLQLLSAELPFVKNNFKTYFKIGLKLEDTFNHPTLFYYLQHTNFLQEKRAAVRVIAPDKEAAKIEIPIALKESDTLYSPKSDEQVATTIISNEVWNKNPTDIGVGG